MSEYPCKNCIIIMSCRTACTKVYSKIQDILSNYSDTICMYCGHELIWTYNDKGHRETCHCKFCTAISNGL